MHRLLVCRATQTVQNVATRSAQPQAVPDSRFDWTRELGHAIVFRLAATMISRDAGQLGQASAPLLVRRPSVSLLDPLRR